MNNVTEQVLPIYKPITLNLIADPNTFEFIPGQTYHFSLRRIPPLNFDTLIDDTLGVYLPYSS